MPGVGLTSKELDAELRQKAEAAASAGQGPKKNASLGSVNVIFSSARPADDLIVKKVATGSGWKVVTADRALAARIQRRQVEIVDPGAFMAELESLPPGEERVAGEEWLAYFSDPKNRNVF